MSALFSHPPPPPPFHVTDLATPQRERIPQELDGVPRRERRPEIPRRRVPGAGMKGNHPRGAPREAQPWTCTGGEAEGYCSPVSNNDMPGSDHQIYRPSSSRRPLVVPRATLTIRLARRGFPHPPRLGWVLIVSDLDPCRRVTRWYRTMENISRPLGVLSEFWVWLWNFPSFLAVPAYLGRGVLSCTLCPSWQNEVVDGWKLRQVRLEEESRRVQNVYPGPCDPSPVGCFRSSSCGEQCTTDPFGEVGGGAATFPSCAPLFCPLVAMLDVGINANNDTEPSGRSRLFGGGISTVRWCEYEGQSS